MNNFRFEPISFVGGKARIPLRLEDVMNYNVYEEVWLDNDDKESDIAHLIDQNRLSY